ncbi:murein transglycosylase A [Sulfuriferula sp.]|uniref:murein transglycosylase A n=1 Tax=Sulfuriferula sp. TaxID=2025307 RepID=UPI00272FE1C8|nr:murein transglycosylase A [Sulfuriferula sp.]MDP2025214.1 murein transglycosylase A [Sulfuriferula sp.]
MRHLVRTAFVLTALLLGGCATQPQPLPPVTPKPLPPVVAPTPPVTPPPIPTISPNLSAADWRTLPGWQDDNLLAAWPAWLQSCSTLKNRPEWREACATAINLNPTDATAVRRYFQDNFSLYQSLQADGAVNGLVTGYYEPLLHGSRTPSTQYSVPLYGVPPDLLTIDLASVYPELKNMRLRGRLQGTKVVPYLSRNEIDTGNDPLKGNELVWVDNPVEAFFLQIQGSGRVRLPDGSLMRVGYADQNGYPYRSIGRVLADRGELPLAQTSMQNIKAWGQKNPAKLPELLSQNPSFVFFRELPASDNGPLGALGVPLTGERSIAVDARAIPLGAPVWLATTVPFSNQPLNRLVMAQDTGGAIRGNVRADYFWGFGDAAGRKAGSMKQQGQMWVMLPIGMAVPTVLAAPMASSAKIVKK